MNNDLLHILTSDSCMSHSFNLWRRKIIPDQALKKKNYTTENKEPFKKTCMHFQMMHRKCPISMPGCAPAEQLNHANPYDVHTWFTGSEHRILFQGITSTHLKSLGLQNCGPLVVRVSFSKNNSSGDLLKWKKVHLGASLYRTLVFTVEKLC